MCDCSRVSHLIRCAMCLASNSIAHFRCYLGTHFGNAHPSCYFFLNFGTRIFAFSFLWACSWAYTRQSKQTFGSWIICAGNCLCNNKSDLKALTSSKLLKQGKTHCKCFGYMRKAINGNLNFFRHMHTMHVNGWEHILCHPLPDHTNCVFSSSR